MHYPIAPLLSFRISSVGVKKDSQSTSRVRSFYDHKTSIYRRPTSFSYKPQTGMSFDKSTNKLTLAGISSITLFFGSRAFCDDDDCQRGGLRHRQHDAKHTATQIADRIADY